MRFREEQLRVLGNLRRQLLDYSTTFVNDVIISNMKAELLLDRRIDLDETRFAELVLWRVPQPVRGSRHAFKYRLANVVGGVCVLRYDNEAGKGDHRHIAGVDAPAAFTGPDRLLADFWNDVTRWNDENRSA